MKIRGRVVLSADTKGTYNSEKTKVVFECGQCGFEWSAGVRGDEYLAYCQNMEEAKEIGIKYWNKRAMKFLDPEAP